MNTDRQTILFVSPCTPDRNGVGWEQRAYSLLLAYSNFMNVDLWFMPTSDNHDLKRLNNIIHLCKSITVFYPILLKNDESLRARLNQSLISSRCVHYFRMTAFLGFHHKCVFWDIDELPPELRDESRNQGFKPLPQEQKTRVFSNFSLAYQRAKTVFSCSPLERNDALGKIEFIPNVSLEIDKFKKRKKSNKILFVGNTNFYPNVDAILFFTKYILPLLPDFIKLQIVGRGPFKEDLRKIYSQLELNPRIEFFYDVESCSPYYDDAALAVVPVKFGGGTKLKILEAFAHGCPVVATSKGCEGLNVKDGEELLIRDSSEEFASACNSIIVNSSLGEIMSEKAYNLISSEYSQAVVDRCVYTMLRNASVLQ